MIVQLFAPKVCTAELSAQLLALIPPSDSARATQLLQRLVFDQYENCARLAEMWPIDHDLNEDMLSADVGEAIAEAIRREAETWG